MKILLLEPFFAGSHKKWCIELKQNAPFDIDILSLPGRFWKWRMHGAAISFASKLCSINEQYQLVVASDMLDIATFKALGNVQIPIVLYFHENQITYPWSEDDADVSLKRDRHYGFINYTSALAADWCVFNSTYHKKSFLESLHPFLRAFPDHQNLGTVDDIEAKSSVLPLGLDLQRLDTHNPGKIKPNKHPLILWNHRWEYDKNPQIFFSSLHKLKNDGLDFSLVLLGEKQQTIPDVFKSAMGIFSDEIIHTGYTEQFEDYARWLWKSDIAPVTSNQDFFGISAVEAMYCCCLPLLPSRLAFPEHLPEGLHSEYLYDSDVELYDKLRKHLLDRDYAHSKEIRSHLFQYDWSVVMEKYAALFERMVP